MTVTSPDTGSAVVARRFGRSLIGASPWSVGRCRGQHGEIMQGMFRIGPGNPARELVTLPYRDGGSTAFAQLTPPGSGVVVEPEGRDKAVRAAELTLAELRIPRGARITLSNSLSLGWGLGSSTADVVATIRAVARAAGRSLP